MAVALIQVGDRYFLQRRSLTSRVFPGRWEFPGGKFEGTESPLEALHRELEEELGWLPACAEALPLLVHPYPEFEVVLHPFLCSGVGTPRTELAWAWVLPGEILRFPVPAATGRLVAQVLIRH